MDYTRKASIQRKTLWQQIADVLREDIIRGKIKPGERIVEEDIAGEVSCKPGTGQRSPASYWGGRICCFMSLIKAVQ